QVGAEVLYECVDLGEFRVAVGVHGRDLGGQSDELRELLVEIAVMNGLDVLAERACGELGPVLITAGRSSRSDGGDGVREVHSGGTAGLGQGSVAVTTEVQTKSVENFCRAWPRPEELSEGGVTGDDRLWCGIGHFEEPRCLGG